MSRSFVRKEFGLPKELGKDFVSEAELEFESDT